MNVRVVVAAAFAVEHELLAFSAPLECVVQLAFAFPIHVDIPAAAAAVDDSVPATAVVAVVVENLAETSVRLFLS